MLKFYNYDIVFQEIPDEVTLAVNITNCPNHCPECHSKFLWEDIGESLNEENINIIMNQYRIAITCFCFMGGDNEPTEVNYLASYIKKKYAPIKIGWYSGKENISEKVNLNNFDYIKVGPYDRTKGSLKNRTTNQHLYKILPNQKKEDITSFFWKKQ